MNYKFKTLFLIFLYFIPACLYISCSREPVVHPKLILRDALTPPPEGFVDAKEIIPSITVELRYFSTNNFIGEKLKGYEANRAYLRPRTAAKLAKVQEELQKSGLSIKIWDSYRPLRAEYQMLDWAREQGRYDLLIDGYLNTNIKVTFKTSHPNGNCVDCTIVDAQGRELDMGTDFDTFSQEAWTVMAEGKVLENRLLLKKIMEKNGFKNFFREWWHYTDWNAPGPIHDDVIIN